MSPTIERNKFSERLQQALRDAEYTPDSPTQLAREFNVRFDGRPITVHAARKWLVGEAIPTQEKVRTLARWLGVTTEWLRFGGDPSGYERSPERAPADMSTRLDSADVKLISDLQQLSGEYRTLAREFIRMLVRTSRQK
jgi:hypothetical protein